LVAVISSSRVNVVSKDVEVAVTPAEAEVQAALIEGIGLREQLLSQSRDIARAGGLVVEALRAGGKLLICGNGGSAADAQHIAAELTGRFKVNRPPIGAIALTTDTSALTAIANDFGYDVVFSRQVEALGRRGDVLLAITTSGNSPNVVLAAEKARALGMTVIGLTGPSSGKLGEHAQLSIAVPGRTTDRIQELHITVGHIVCGLVESALFA
jgi:D-sedoheptulose 7-phosphate isomerase